MLTYRGIHAPRYSQMNRWEFFDAAQTLQRWPPGKLGVEVRGSGTLVEHNRSPPTARTRCSVQARQARLLRDLHYPFVLQTVLPGAGVAPTCSAPKRSSRTENQAGAPTRPGLEPWRRVCSTAPLPVRSRGESDCCFLNCMHAMRIVPGAVASSKLRQDTLPSTRADSLIAAVGQPQIQPEWGRYQWNS